MSPGKLRTLCEVEWPTFNIGWPSEGTLDLAGVRCIYIMVTGNPGHPDQFPYIDAWLEIARTLPPWVGFCSSEKGQCRILVAQAPKGTPNPPPTQTIQQGVPEEELPIPPPPYIPPVPPTAPDAVPDTPPPSVLPLAAQPEDRPAEPTPQDPIRCLRPRNVPALQMPLHETRGPDLMAPTAPFSRVSL
ncbi:hypothetical protein mRhiFer1_009054 [Rhinolophus ferrumequinum]|uniref:Gamma-retroviral matrix protein domain-containing protein n=1 Tax=Rhinolophus ferrumequinum TaxID=59479 RepID=A0A7J7SY28_RHIFE|nr:hypothetical protein mRhiFer1_009054 [Rhinolophus ferrumequinum]